MVWIIDNLIEVLYLFAVDVAGADPPISAILLLSSVAILTVALGVFGVLALGGILSPLTGK